jgi:hypothetical protein
MGAAPGKATSISHPPTNISSRSTADSLVSLAIAELLPSVSVSPIAIAV